MLSKLNAKFPVSFLLLLISFFVLSACRNEDGEKAFVAAVEVVDNDVQSIQIMPGKQGSILEANASSQFSVIATLGDSSTEDVSDRVTWASSDASVLTVTETGLVAAGSVSGTADVSVSWSYLSASIPIEVSTAKLTSLAFSNLSGSLSECLAGTALSVEGTYDDGRTSDVSELISSWASSDAAVAKVDTSGVLDTLNSGNVTLEATYGGQIASRALVVSDSLTAISLEPSADFNLETAASRSLIVSATDPSETRDVSAIATYTDSPTGVLSIDSSGRVTAGATVGSAVVSASCGGLTTSPITVTVTEPKTVTELIIRYENASTSPAGPFDTSDSPIQLRAFLRYSDASELEVTDSDFTNWAVRSTIDGNAATISNDGSDKGEVRFNQTGRTELEAIYDDDNNNVYKEDTIDVLVE
jgi:Bacterial Ig-like domain (group 2)